MFHPGNTKLGKRAAVHDSRRLKMVKYMGSSLGPVLSEVDHTHGIVDFGMMLNGPNDGSTGAPKDGLGCCTISGCGHAEQIVSLAVGGEITLPDAAILQKYEQWDGYRLGDPSTDQGGNEPDVLNKWRRQGFWRHRLAAYADLDPQSIDAACKTIEILGGLYIGVQLPASAQNQNIWDVTKGWNAAPGSWGGHCVYVPKYKFLSDGEVMFWALTWGGLMPITQAFWTYSAPGYGPYIDEIHGLVLPDFLSRKTGRTPEGFDLAAIEADAQALAA
jgi:hypothetical protein